MAHSSRRQAILFFFLFIVYISGNLYAETYTSDDIKAATGADFYWDPYRRSGMFVQDSRSLAFLTDSGVLLLDGKTMVSIDDPIVYNGGKLLFSERTAAVVAGFFGKDIGDIRPLSPYRVGVILIDPGHGGKDTGATAVYTVDGLRINLHEKWINLDAALRLKEMLEEKYPDKIVLLTRNDDTYNSLGDIVEMTNRFELDPYEGMIFISIHTNASMNTRGEGYEIWYLPSDYRRDIINSKTGNDPDVLPVLNLLWEEEFTMESRKLAELILNGMSAGIRGRTPNRGIKEESWFVVTNKKMASVLIELGFLTNEKDASLLRNTEYMKDVTTGIFNGIIDFIDYFERRELSP